MRWSLLGGYVYIGFSVFLCGLTVPEGILLQVVGRVQECYFGIWVAVVISFSYNIMCKMCKK